MTTLVWGLLFYSFIMVFCSYSEIVCAWWWELYGGIRWIMSLGGLFGHVIAITMYYIYIRSTWQQILPREQKWKKKIRYYFMLTATFTGKILLSTGYLHLISTSILKFDWFKDNFLYGISLKSTNWAWNQSFIKFIDTCMFKTKM